MTKKTPPKKKYYKTLESEEIKKRVEGTTTVTKQGYEVRLNKYNNCFDCELEFLNVEYPYSVRIEYRSFRDKTVQYPYHPTKFGVGFIGEGAYKSSNIGKDSIEYTYWDGFMRRCYSKRVQNICKTYKDCSSAREWDNFQTFSKWFNDNFNADYMKGWCLDKDILVKGNRVYSAENCAFVPNEINVLFTNSYIKRGKYPKGVSYKPRIRKYIAQYQNNGNVIHIGVYKTPEEAFYAYKEVKENYIKQKADEWKGLIDPRVYQAMYNYQVEITD